jgi:hypothetical protein
MVKDKNKGHGPCTEATLEHELGLHAGPRTIVFKMRDEQGFYKALPEHTGQKEWIAWRDVTIPTPAPAVRVRTMLCHSNSYFRKHFLRHPQCDTSMAILPLLKIRAVVAG